MKKNRIPESLVLFFAVLVAVGCGCAAPVGVEPAKYPYSVVCDDPAVDSPLLSGENMVDKWQTLGVFLAVFGEENPQRSSLHYEYLPREKDLTRAWKTPDYLEWRDASPSQQQPLACDFNAVWPDGAVIFAVRELFAPEELTGVTMKLGSSGFIKVWLNGELIHTYDRDGRVGAPDQGMVNDLTLKKGVNRLVVKTVRTGEVWNFFCRFTRGDRTLRVTNVTPPPVVPREKVR